MYLPKLFKSEDFNVLKEIIRDNSFASLITYNEKILSTKAMMQMKELENEHFIIETHIAKANPVAIKMKQGDEVLCDFLGAHAYISSSWYNHVEVSTWNYEEVQIEGRVEMMSDSELYNHLKKLTDFFELPQKCPMTFDRMQTEYIKKEMRGALGINIIPTDVRIKQKLSQNRDKANYDKIIENLNESHFSMDKIMAKKMTDLNTKR